MGTTQRLLLTMALLFIGYSTYAQSALNLKVGLIERSFRDEADLRHCGMNFGLDAIIEDSRFLFMPGLHYQRYSIAGQQVQESKFSKSESLHQISLPVSMGTWLMADRWAKFRVYGGGHINFIVGVDENDLGINLDRVTTVHPGWQVGGQVMLWKVTADIRYYRDYRKIINVRENSAVAGWEFLVGIAL
jgi:hypothetical protein